MADAHIINILVVEDDPVIALDTVEMLCALRGVTVATAYSLEEALRLGRSAHFDFAVLDFQLGHDTDSTPVAEMLSVLGIPYVFVTGSAIEVKRSFPGTRILEKPIDVKNLTTLVGEVRR